MTEQDTLQRDEKDRHEEHELEEIERRTPIGVRIVHDAILADGQVEIRRSTRALFWSGLAAGLSMGFSFLAMSMLHMRLPDAPWTTLIVSFGYSIGFLIVILGRQQLFTENTLTAVLPLLHERAWSTFLNVLRVWGVVLFANMLGATAFSFALAHGGMFDGDELRSFEETARHAIRDSFWPAFGRAIFAGWMIALIVWLMPASEGAHFQVILVISYLVGIAGLGHIIAGSVEVLFLVWTGAITLGQYLAHFFTPVLLGNITGGVLLTTAINHAQVVTDTDQHERGRMEQALRRLMMKD